MQRQERVKPTFDKESFQLLRGADNAQSSSDEKPVLKGRPKGLSSNSNSKPGGFDTKAWNSHG